MKNGKKAHQIPEATFAAVWISGRRLADCKEYQHGIADTAPIHRTHQTRSKTIPKLRGAAPSLLMQPMAVASPQTMQSRNQIMEELQMKKSLTSKQQLDMLTAVQQIRELETAKREILHAIAEQQERIKTLMTDKQLEELELDEYVVRYVSVTSKRFNTSAFKKTHADLYEQYTETVSSKRFSIS